MATADQIAESAGVGSPPVSFGARVARSTASVSAASAIVVGVGFLREVVTARWFGATYQVDAFLIAFTVMTFLPNLVSQTLLGVFIPLVTRIRSQNPREAWALAGSGLNYLIMSFTLLSLALWILRQPLVEWAAPGFGWQESRASYPILLILVPVAVLWVLNEYLKAILNCLSEFFWPSFSQVFPGAGAILGMLFLAKHINVESLAWGWLAGTVVQSAVLIWHLRGSEFQYIPEWHYSRSALPELVKLSLPYFWVHFAINALYFIDRYFASQVGPGAIAQLYFADRLLRLPIILFTVPLFTAFHPHVSEQLVRNGIASLKVSVSGAIRTTALLALPLGTIAAVLSEPVVSLIYQGGRFSHQDVVQTASLLQYFMPLIFLMTVFFILDRSFNALGNPAVLMKASLLMLAVKCVSTPLLLQHFGIIGLPLGTILMFVSGVVMLWGILLRKIEHFESLGLYVSIGKTLFASVLAGTSVFFLSRAQTFRPGFVASGKLSMALLLLVLGIVGAVLYIVFLYVLRSEDVGTCWKTFKQLWENIPGAATLPE